MMSTTLLKRRLQQMRSPVNFAKFLRTPFFTEHLRTTASIISHDRCLAQSCELKN